MIWCLGMHGSGSTWLFNAARETAQALHPGARVTGIYAEDLESLKALDRAALNIVKTHHLGRAETHFMAQNARHILISIRDPRDAVTSLMQHMRHSFGRALDRTEHSAAFCASFAQDSRARILSYDAGFTDDPATFDRIAAMLGGRLDEAARAALFAASRREVIEARIARLEELPNTWQDERSGDIVDLDTQWHRHHAGRTGEIGRWRRLLPPEASRIIEQRMAGFMTRFGYLP
jgi:phosphoenolpyruvate-protein kinase (PTS system EI component)